MISCAQHDITSIQASLLQNLHDTIATVNGSEQTAPHPSHPFSLLPYPTLPFAPHNNGTMRRDATALLSPPATSSKPESAKKNSEGE